MVGIIDSLVLLIKQLYNIQSCYKAELFGGCTLEKLLEKLKEYLKMETEIPFDEFSEYYRNLIAELNQTFNDLDRENRVKALYICSIVQSNAEARAKESKATAKTFKKISAKCAFWTDAIKFNLGKDGMSSEEIEQATEEINASI